MVFYCQVYIQNVSISEGIKILKENIGKKNPFKSYGGYQSFRHETNSL